MLPSAGGPVRRKLRMGSSMGTDEASGERSCDDGEAVVAVGTRVAIDAHQCGVSTCRSLDGLVRLVAGIADVLRADVLRVASQDFPGGGLTVVAILSASHCVVHSWPEFGYISVDLFVCNTEVDLQALDTFVGRTLGAR